MPHTLPRQSRLAIPVALAVAFALTAIPAPALAHSKSHHRHTRHPTRHRALARTVPFQLPAAPRRNASATQVPPVITGCSDTDLVPAPENLARVAAATLCLVNQQRAASGEPPLRSNATLAAAASRHTMEMVARNYFAHVGPAGDSPLDRLRTAGYVRPNTAFSIGENIAWGTGPLATPGATVDAWMHSPEHRANILTAAFRETGIGVAAGNLPIGADALGAVYTQDFGTTG